MKTSKIGSITPSIGYLNKKTKIRLVKTLLEQGHSKALIKEITGFSIPTISRYEELGFIKEKYCSCGRPKVSYKKECAYCRFLSKKIKPIKIDIKKSDIGYRKKAKRKEAVHYLMHRFLKKNTEIE